MLYYQKGRTKDILFSLLYAILFVFTAMPAFASYSITVNGTNNSPLFTYNVLEAGESAAGETAAWDLSDNHISALVNGGEYIASLFGAAATNSTPAGIFTHTQYKSEENANALSVAHSQYPGYTNITAQILFNAKQDAYNSTEVEIVQVKGEIGFYDFNPITVLPQNGKYTTLAATIAHELGHAIGIHNGFFDVKVAGLGDSAQLGEIKNLFGEKLVDPWGNPFTSNTNITLLDKDDLSYPTEPEGVYVVDSTIRPGFGHVYFTGDNVKKVLDGADVSVAEFRPADPSNTFDLANHIPVNVEIEKKNDGSYGIGDFAHIELRNSMMSHQSYRNWGTFMEAELALLQDIGIPVDRSQFFGKSVYHSGKNDSGNITYNFATISPDTFAWGQNAYNPAPLAVGLHIYGSYNDVTMQSNALSSGFGGVGIRVDGVENVLTVAEGAKIASNGEMGTGLMVTYGKNHTVTVDGSISATGDGGVGVRFDFGDNILGNKTSYLGSYIWTLEKDENDYFTPNVDGKEKEVNDALVRTFDVSGTIEGSDKAIFISRNALVKDINLKNGAEIYGDIVSEWNPNAEINYLYGAKIDKAADSAWVINNEDGMTTLTYGETGQPSAIYHNGNINGKDSLQWRIIGDTTVKWGGKADVLNFEQKGNATLLLNPLLHNSITTHGSGADGILKFDGAQIGVQSGFMGYTSSDAKVGNHSLLTLDSINGGTVIAAPIQTPPYPKTFALGFYDFIHSGVTYDSTTQTYSLHVTSKEKNKKRVAGVTTGAATYLALQNPAMKLLRRQQERGFAIQKKMTDAHSIAAPSDEHDNGKMAEHIRTESGQHMRVGQNSVWFSGSFDYSIHDDINTTMPTFMMGMDRWLTDNIQAGMAISFGYAHMLENNTNLKGTTVSIMPYTAFRLPYDVELGLYASLGTTNYDQQRNIYGDTYSVSYTAQTIAGGASISRPFAMTENVILRPFVNYDYTYTERYGYNEGDGKFALRVGNTQTNSHRVEGGVNVGYTWESGDSVAVGARYSGLFGDRRSSSTVAFVRDENHESVESRGNSLDMHSVGVNIEAAKQITDDLRLFGVYDLLKGESGANHHFRLAVEYNF